MWQIQDITHAAFPFLAGKENDFASAFGWPSFSTAIVIAAAAVAAWIGGYLVQQRLYGERAQSGSSYGVLSTLALLAILGVTVGLGI